MHAITDTCQTHQKHRRMAVEEIWLGTTTLLTEMAHQTIHQEMLRAQEAKDIEQNHSVDDHRYRAGADHFYHDDTQQQQ